LFIALKNFPDIILLYTVCTTNNLCNFHPEIPVEEKRLVCNLFKTGFVFNITFSGTYSQID
jgi:hypothetical protein